MNLFAEVFPLAAAPRVAAYTLRFDAAPPDVEKIGRTLARRLSKTYGTTWTYADGQLLTDDDRSAVELMIALDILRTDAPQTFGALQALDAVTVTPQAAADYVIRTTLKAHESALTQALHPFNSTLQTPSAIVHVHRDYTLRAWAAMGQPCVAITVATRLTYGQDLQTFAESLPSTAELIGLRVTDRVSGIVGDVVKVSGKVGARRDKMFSRARSDAHRELIRSAAGGGWAVRLKAGSRLIELPARALEPMIRPNDTARFGLDAEAVARVLRLEPAERARMIRALADVCKQVGVLANAYNTRDHAALFHQPPFEPYVRFANKRTRPFQPRHLANTFIQYGAYHVRQFYRSAPIRVCVVNAVATPIEDFVEAMQRQLTRGIGFKVDMVRERKVRVVSLANIESAVRVVEKESPDVILAFLPDESVTSEGQDLTEYIKFLTLGRGIPTHVIFKATLDDAESMPSIIMAMLAKTGSTPFALADSLEWADDVVGLDFIDDPERGVLLGIARVYSADGQFVRYSIRTQPATDEKMRFVLLRDLLPQRDFGGRRVLIHHEGALNPANKQALRLWGKATQTRFMLVEMIRRGAPRLYGLRDGQVLAAPIGSAFMLDDSQAFFVAAHDADTPTPQSVHVIAEGVDVREAMRSIRLFRLLHTQSTAAPPQPVTTFNAAELAYWLQKGGAFTENDGHVPFWL